ncbi:unnamed protein product [Rhizoctonia solani]|nr:unnamed protein product [Rhizoctonia solani]
MSSHRSEASGSSGSQGSQRLWPCADVVLPLLPTDINPDQSFCVEVPWSLNLLQEADAQSPTRVRRRTDEPAPRLQLGRYVLDRSQAWPSCASSQPTTTRQTRCRPKPACLICLETSDHTDAWIKPTAQCTHGPVICVSCFREYIVHQVVVEGSATLICPDPGCRRVLEHTDVVIRIKDKAACLDRYHTLRVQMDLRKHPNFVWCLDSSCGRGQVHNQGAAAPVVICGHCRARSCFRHQVPWHAGLTCEQYTNSTKYKQENHASEEYIAKHAKRCPNPSCRRPILKIDGCDHMICYRPGGCGHEFCWACLAGYATIREQGNHHHEVGCPHYSEPPRRIPVQSLENLRALARVPAPPTRARFRALPFITEGDEFPVPRPLVPTRRPPQHQPNVDPPRRPILAPVPVIPDPGPVSLPAPPLTAVLHSVREEASTFSKARDIISTIYFMAHWSLVCPSLILVVLILRAGEAKFLAWLVDDRQ